MRVDVVDVDRDDRMREVARALEHAAVDRTRLERLLGRLVDGRGHHVRVLQLGHDVEPPVEGRAVELPWHGP